MKKNKLIVAEKISFEIELVSAEDKEEIKEFFKIIKKKK